MIRILKTDLFRLFRSKVLLAFPLLLAFSLLMSLLVSNNVTYSTDEEIGWDQGTGTAKYQDPDHERVRGGYINRNIDPEDVKEAEFADNVTYNGTDAPMEVSITEDDGVVVSVTLQPGESFMYLTNDYEQRHVFTGLPDLFEALFDGLILFLLGLTIVIFCTCETREGFVKNAAGCAIDRRYMPISKMIVGFVVFVIYVAEFVIYHLLSVLIESAITGKSIFFRPLPEGDAGKFWGFIIVCVLIHMAFTALLVMLHELTGNRALGIVSAAILAFGILEYMANGAVYLLKHFFHILNGFNIDKYLLLQNIKQGYDDAAYHPQTVLILTLVYLIAGAVLAIVITKKRDVR